ncbi:hypothetical protein ACFY8S_09250 [Streptomyces hygroscopicus]|uniref:hypothetical protein n=1 Tax=Streptomyces hygroscopicus TaxID=1912 RepID=UPI0036B32904
MIPHPLIIIALGVAAGSAFIALLRWTRVVGVRQMSRPGHRPAFLPAPPGTRWLICHDTACGHMTTRHTPQPDGTYRCARWPAHRGDVHLTRTTTEEGRDA